MVKLSRNDGFTYPMVLGFVLSIAILGQAVVTSQQMNAKRQIDIRVEAKAEEFLRAIESYWFFGGEDPTLPTSLDDLLRDPRNSTKRHLRSPPGH